MTIDTVTPIKALMKQVTDAMGVHPMMEGAATIDIQNRTLPMLALQEQPASVNVNATDAGFAMLDTLIEIPVRLYYLMQTAAGQTDLMTLRGKLNDMAEAVLVDPRTWAVDNPIVRVEPVGYGLGSSDDYGGYFQREGQPLAAGHIDVRIQVLTA